MGAYSGDDQTSDTELISPRRKISETIHVMTKILKNISYAYTELNLDSKENIENYPCDNQKSENISYAYTELNQLEVTARKLSMWWPNLWETVMRTPSLIGSR